MAINILGLVGCMPLQQYREKPVYQQAQDCEPGTPAAECPIGLARSHPGYGLGVVEFDDQGELYSEGQFEFVRNHIERPEPGDAAHDGKLVVVFAHGWFHNGSPGDENLAFFGQMLSVMAQDEEAVAQSEGRKPRRVEGVFLAWRGASSSLPLLKYVTFWNRKDTAHRIGERRATEAIISLRDAAYSGTSISHDYPNRFILMGHSFGGALVYSATSQLIADHLLQPINPEVPRSPLADAIILFNPAFEAARIQHLLDTAAVLKDRLPTLSIFTSKSDQATGMAFPFARFINTIFESYRSGVPNPIRPGTGFSQRTADTRTAGHFDPFITHDLIKAKSGDASCAPKPELMTHVAENMPKPDAATPAPMPAPPSGEVADKIANAQDQLMTAYANSDTVLNFGETCLVARDGLLKRQLAVLNVSIDADLWDGHGIEQTPDRVKLFLGFLEHYIPFAASGDTVTPPLVTAPQTVAPEAGIETHASRPNRLQRHKFRF